MEKQVDSFEIKRQNLLESMVERAKKRGEKTITKNVNYRNKDIEIFLKQLNDFEEKYKLSTLQCKICTLPYAA